MCHCVKCSKLSVETHFPNTCCGLTWLGYRDEVLRALVVVRALALVVLHGVGVGAVEGEAGGEVARGQLGKL